MAFTCGAAVVLAALAVTPAFAADGDADFLNFLAGDYIIVGREPDGGAAYNGQAAIDVRNDGVVMHGRRGGVEIIATGRLDAASPGEGRVLRFHSGKPAATDMTCLVSTDLDNYARLTCLWWRIGTQPKQPGLEAMFPTGAWPDTAR
jgi:hypothetical protein